MWCPIPVMKIKWFLVIDLFYDCMYRHTYVYMHICLVCAHMCVFIEARGTSLGVILKTSIYLLRCRASHGPRAQQFMPYPPGQQSPGILMAPSPELWELRHTTVPAIFRLFMLFVVSALVMECFSLSMLNVMRETNNTLLFVFCLLPSLFIHFPFLPSGRMG